MDLPVLLITSIVFVAAVISGATGLAGSVIILGTLLCFLPVAEAVIIHGVIFFVLSTYRMYLFREGVCYRTAVYFLVGGVIAIVPLSLFTFVPNKAVSLIVLGASSVFCSLYSKLPSFNLGKPRVAATTGAAAVTAIAFFGISAPVFDMAFARSKWNKMKVMGTKSALASTNHFIKVFYFLFLANTSVTISADWIVLSGILLLVSLVGVRIGKNLTEMMSESLFQHLGRGLVASTGVYYVARGLML